MPGSRNMKQVELGIAPGVKDNCPRLSRHSNKLCFGNATLREGKSGREEKAFGADLIPRRVRHVFLHFVNVLGAQVARGFSRNSFG
jgi:hypothetical protein